MNLVRQMKRAAIYIRISTGEQNLDLQSRELPEYCGRRGWDVAAVYEDRVSGAKDRRTGLDRLIADARRRKSTLWWCGTLTALHVNASREDGIHSVGSCCQTGEQLSRASYRWTACGKEARREIRSACGSRGRWPGIPDEDERVELASHCCRDRHRQRRASPVGAALKLTLPTSARQVPSRLRFWQRQPFLGVRYVGRAAFSAPTESARRHRL